jgi:uncharacterized protein GlcG (DUF336 family)
LSIAWAVECIERGFAKATELGFKVTVAVVDEDASARDHPEFSGRVSAACAVFPTDASEERVSRSHGTKVAGLAVAGHLVASHRMDGALWVTPDIARAKANAAAAFRASTADLEERFSGARHLFASNVATLGDHRFVFGRGAVPLMEKGIIVGAVGVSGAVPADNDQLIAEAAAGHPTAPKGH